MNKNKGLCGSVSGIPYEDYLKNKVALKASYGSGSDGDYKDALLAIIVWTAITGIYILIGIIIGYFINHWTGC